KALRHDLARLARLGVLRGPRGREVRVRRLEPPGERGGVERGAELTEVVVALGDLPEEEVRLGPDAGRGVGTQMLEPRRVLREDVGERVLVGGSFLDGQAPPRRIDAEERVGDVLARHERKVTAAVPGGPAFSAARAEPDTRCLPAAGRDGKTSVVGAWPTAVPVRRRRPSRTTV